MSTPIPPTPKFVGPIGIYPASSDFELMPDGFDYTLDIKSRYTEKFSGPYVNLYAAGVWGVYNRGVISGEWIINNARLQLQRSNVGILTINWESINQVPYDEWSVTQWDLQPRIERHPRYSTLTEGDFTVIQQALLSATTGALNTALNNLSGTSNPALATELYKKMRDGMETYYLAGARYTWTTYYRPGYLPTPSEGGYTESPGGPAGYVLPAGFAWLRTADDYGLALYAPLGGITKLTRVWLGAGGSYWDTDIYPAGPP
ncbi:MAG: hypothetical protein ACLQVY_18185 [Limisphaerales bacterium]